MISEDILDAIGGISDESVALAAKPARRRKALRIAALAAAVCAIGAAIIVPAALRGRKPTLVADGGYYSILKKGESYYIQIDESALEGKHTASGIGSLAFTSVDELVDKIKNGSFDEWEIAVINDAFPKDEKENKVKIFDIDNPYYAALPDGYSCLCIHWSGQSYSFELQGENCSGAFLHWQTQKQFDSYYKLNYLDFFERDTINLISEEKEESGETEYIYTTSEGRFKRVRYTLGNGSIVDEHYILESFYDRLNVSEDVPDSISLYYRADDYCMTLEVFDLGNRPTIEELSQFSLTSKQ